MRVQCGGVTYLDESYFCPVVVFQVSENTVCFIANTFEYLNFKKIVKHIKRNNRAHNMSKISTTLTKL